MGARSCRRSTSHNVPAPAAATTGVGERFDLGPRAASTAEAQPRRPWPRCWGQNNPNKRPLSRADGRQEMTGGGTG